MPRDAFFAVMAEATRLALPVVGHVPMTVTPTEASNAGQTTLEHAETIFEGTFSTTLGSEPLAQAIARWRTSPAAKELFDTFVKNGTIIDPTLVAGRWSLMWLEGRIDLRDDYIAASARREATEILGPLREDAAALLAERRPLVHELEAVVAQMHRAGVGLVTGTDLAFALHPGFSVHDELQAFSDIGLTPAEALRTSTLHAAELFPELDAGEVRVGKRADLDLLAEARAQAARQ